MTLKKLSLQLNRYSHRTTDMSIMENTARVITHNEPVVDICRVACTSAECRRVASYESAQHKNAKTMIRNAVHGACTPDKAKKRVLSFLPFISVLKSYKWREWILSDVIAGLSIGVVHIPQSMGNALLCSIPTVYGLYSSFFPVILYFFFGTSRHISFGTMALTSLLIGSVVNSEVERLGLDSAVNQTNIDVDSTKVGVACAVSLLIGLVQIVMGMLHLGVIASFMSMTFIGGFMAGAGVHITTSQLPFLLGLRLQRTSGTAKIPRFVINVFRNITSINLAELLIAGISIAMLLGCTLANERLQKRGFKVPIPGELLVVVISALFSHFIKFHDRFNVRIVGGISTGIPTPELPPLDNAALYIGDAILIAIISYVVSISMVKIFARKYNYEIDANQEFLAYGIAHSVSSCFLAFAGAQGPPRSFMNDRIGGRTQVASLFSSAVVLIACLVAAPLLKPLPLSTLSAIIVTSIIPLLTSYRDIPSLWRTNRYDAAVWLITWAVVSFVDIIIGLAVGVAVSLLTVIVQTRLARGDPMGRIDSQVAHGVYTSLKKYKLAQPIDNVHIFRYPAILYFANVDNFKQQLFAATINPNRGPQLREITVNVKQDRANDKAINNAIPTISGNGIKLNDITEVNKNTSTELNAPNPCQTVIIDCSAMTYIDVMGLNALKQIAGDYAAIGVNFVLCCCCESLLDKLHAAGIAKEDGTAHTGIYPTLDDAVASARYTSNVVVV